MTTANVTPDNGTPDDGTTPFGFAPEGNGDHWRTRIGSWALVTAALPVGSALHPRIGPKRGHAIERMWARSLVRALRMSVEQEGVGHIDPSEQYLVMPLHESFIDVPTLLHLSLDLRFTVRDELFDLPHLGRYLAETNQIAVAEAPTVGDLRRLYSGVAEAVAQGDSIVVFPQGSILGVEVAFRPGIVRLSQRFGLPVLPVAISGTHCVWEYPYAQTLRFDRTVALQVLAPIACADVSAESIRTAERTMKRVALGNPTAPVRRFRPERDGWWDDYRYDIDEDFPELALRVEEHRDAIGQGSATM